MWIKTLPICKVAAQCLDVNRFLIHDIHDYEYIYHEEILFIHRQKLNNTYFLVMEYPWGPYIPESRAEN